MHTKYISICNKNIRVCKFTYKIRSKIVLKGKRAAKTALVRKSDVNKEICLYRYYFLFGIEEVINKNFKKYELESRKLKKFLF
ncbi:hypothetical protein H8356DRAFT_1342348 [Neocallimastix lanati (nom. inval.)]|nr:hypothetical protein H8356DRAFT_1342348 [Neocallimastix sp. JGI-2020a]